ncbi:uncharacterized protein LOC117344710 [Pecten maximus]|uniref:uncharacterized protein LOC117344710 n=1 Tax=Pecten maximus TaxID=6579 RepID=UPI00145818B4|nr:uncharacterized protein LOC117344710 [Pecten maximus]
MDIATSDIGGVATCIAIGEGHGVVMATGDQVDTTTEDSACNIKMVMDSGEDIRVDTAEGDGEKIDIGDGDVGGLDHDYPLKSKDITIISLSDSIRLGYCKNSGCGCKLVHCPFCDKSHFKPAKPSRVRDHLELKHFAHSVKFDDMIIVKCFRDCGDKPKGHYHCPCCTKQLLKRNAFHSHLVKHIKTMKKSPDLVTAPDDKLPSKVVFLDEVLQLCLENCQVDIQEHFHCLYCDEIFVDRSMLVTHMWRCQTGKANQYPNMKLGQEMDQQRADNYVPVNCPHPKDAPDIKWHASVVRSVADLPVEKCEDLSCGCGGSYHCVLCPTSKYKPNSEEHLLTHYSLHWKKRIPYKDYYILICYLPCQGTEEELATSYQYHYHCPVCGESRKRRNCFLHHLRICKGNRESTHRFSITKYKDNNEDKEILSEAEIAVESLTNIEMVASEDPPQETPVIGEASERHCDAGDEDNLTDPVVVQHSPVMTSDYQTNDEAADMSSIDVFEKVTATLSRRLVTAVDQTAMDSVLSRVTKQTNLTLDWSPGISSPQYTLTGRLEDIVMIKGYTVQGSIIGPKNPSEKALKSKIIVCHHVLKVEPPETGPTEFCRKCKAQDFMKPGETNDSTLATTAQQGHERPDDMGNNKKSEILPIKRKRGRPRKNPKVDQTQEKAALSTEGCVDTSILSDSIENTDQVQSSESKETRFITEKRSTTRKRKASSQDTNEKANTDKETVSATSPKRYSTRGKRLDFSAMVGAKKTSAEESGVKSGRNDVANKKLQLNSKEQISQTDIETIADAAEQIPSIATNDTNSVSSISVMKNTNQEPGVLDDIGNDDNEDIYSTVEEGIDVKMISQKNASPLAKRRGDNVAHIPAIVFEDSIKLGRKSINKSENEANLQITSQSQYSEDGIPIGVTGDGGLRDKCNLCDYISDSFINLQQHFLAIHQTQCSFRCDVCEVIFEDESAVSNHLKLKHRPFKQAMKSLLNPELKLKSKIEKNQHKKEYNCLKCDFKTFRLNCLYAHREFIHNDIPICEYCGKKFARFMHMQTHIQAVHTKSKSAVCHICGKNFDHVRYMKAHMKRHSDIKDYVCKICNKRFTERTTLKGHMEIHKKPDERTYRYVCDFCGKRFLNKNTYTDHLNKHTGEKPYHCDMCDKRFTFKSVLDKHKLFKHTTSKPFPCPICRKGFKMQRLLNQHLVTHTGQSNFVCEECGRSFSCKNTLKNHQPKCKGVMRQKSGSNVILVLAEQGLNQSEQVSLTNAVMSLDPQSSNMEATQILTPDGIVHLESTHVMDSVVQEEEEPALYICSECNAVFESFQEVETHVLMGHTDGSIKDGGTVQPHQLIDTLATTTSDVSSAQPILDVQHGPMFISEVDASALVNLTAKDEHTV